MPAEARCQANHGINAVGFRKLTKYCDSFRFFGAFLCPFFLGGHIIYYIYFTIQNFHNKTMFCRIQFIPLCYICYSIIRYAPNLRHLIVAPEPKGLKKPNRAGSKAFLHNALPPALKLNIFLFSQKVWGCQNLFENYISIQRGY